MFLYYIANQGAAVGRQQFAAAGLSHAWSDRDVAKRETARGPDGGRGVVVAFGMDPARVLHDAECQTWRQVPGGTGWVGHYTAERITPEQLARQKQLDGHWIELADGREWLVPIARAHVEEDGELRWLHALPRTSELDEQGRWRPGAVVAAHAALWELAERWETAWSAAVIDSSSDQGEQDKQDVDVTFDFDDLHGGAVAALGANYRLGAVEAAMLGLLTEGLAVEVLGALVDQPTKIEWIKKNLPDPAITNTSDGAEASTPATNPP